MKRTLLATVVVLLLYASSSAYSTLSEPLELKGGEQILVVRALITCYEGSGSNKGRLVCNLLSEKEGGLGFMDLQAEGVSKSKIKLKEVPVWTY